MLTAPAIPRNQGLVMNSIGRKSREAFEKERVEWSPPGAVITSTSFYCLNGFGSEETHTLSAVTWTRGNCVAVSWLLATPSTQRTCSCSGRSVRLLSRTSLWMVHSSFITSWTDKCAWWGGSWSDLRCMQCFNYDRSWMNSSTVGTNLVLPQVTTL